MNLVEKGEGKIEFENTQLAFKGKDDKALKKAYFLFYIINNRWYKMWGNLILDLHLKWKFPMIKWVKKSLFSHFCAGENWNQCKDIIRVFSQENIYCMPEYAVESEKNEKDFQQYKNKCISIIENIGQLNLPFISIKCSALTNRNVLKQNPGMVEQRNSVAFINFEARLDEICVHAIKNKVAILIDAEESWLSPTIDWIGINFMKKYNLKKAWVYLTYQCYLKSTKGNAENHIQMAIKENFQLGLKIVRGAYLEKEKKRAKKLGFLCPVHEGKAETDKAFNQLLEKALENIQHLSLWIGSHNEYSYQLLDLKIKKLGLPARHPKIWIAQLLGMSDNISYTMEKLNYNVVKLLPFGPINKAIPYLIRRAKENSSVKGQSAREFQLIKKELQRRKKIKKK